MGGSLNISFNNGCLSIRYHLFIKMVFKFGTEGRYYIIYRNQINSGGEGFEVFPQHYRGYLKKIQIH